MSKTGYENVKKHHRSELLGRNIPSTFKHVGKYAMTAQNAPSKPVPITIGIDWYTNFDKPVEKNGKYYIGLDANNLGYLRGGHCVTIPHDTKKDLLSWHKHYNQLREGACVGMGVSRCMSLLNRKMYDAFWLWREAKKIDEWEETRAEDNNGTSVSAGFDVARLQGMKLKQGGKIKASEGVDKVIWATTIEQMHDALQNAEYKRTGLFDIVNSWGDNYPRVVKMPEETMHRMIRQYGEIAIVTDR